MTVELLKTITAARIRRGVNPFDKKTYTIWDMCGAGSFRSVCLDSTSTDPSAIKAFGHSGPLQADWYKEEVGRLTVQVYLVSDP